MGTTKNQKNHADAFAEWTWKGFDFLQALRTHVNNSDTTTVTFSQNEAWRFVRSHVSSRTRALAGSRPRTGTLIEVEAMLRSALTRVAKEHPAFLQRVTRVHSPAATHVMLPREAVFPFHYALFRAMGATIEEWEDHFQRMATPLLIRGVATEQQLMDSKMALHVVQKTLGNAFWKACQAHEGVPVDGEVQQRILKEAITLYFQTYYDHATKLPSLREVATRVKCHPNHVHRTMTLTMGTGVVTFHAFPHVFRLGLRVKVGVITASVPHVMHYWLRYVTTENATTNFAGNDEEKEKANDGSHDDNEEATHRDSIHPWLLAPLGTRTWLVAWTTATESEPSSSILPETVETISSITSLARWVDLAQYFPIHHNDDDDTDKANSDHHVFWWEQSVTTAAATPTPCQHLTSVQRAVLHLLQHDHVPARVLARRMDVEPSTITRALKELKDKQLLLPNVTLRFLKPVRPVIMRIKGLEIVNMKSFLHHHVLAVQGLCSGFVFSRSEPAAESYVITSVTDPHAPRELARRLILTFDLHDNDVILHDVVMAGSVGPLIRSPVPAPPSSVRKKATRTT